MKNLPQVAEVNLSRISAEVWRRIDGMSRNKSDYHLIQALLNKYLFTWISAKDHKEFYEYHDSLKTSEMKYQVRTGAFSDYTPASVAAMMNELELSDKEYLYDGVRGRRIKNPIQTGWSYILKLHHFSWAQNKVTTANSRDKNPLVLGVGETRTTGQNIGKFIAALCRNVYRINSLIAGTLKRILL